MRVLLDKECTAVAGGHESECVNNATAAGIATGAVIGGVAGAAAGGVGAVPGAVGGGGVGSLVAQVVAPPLCRWAENRESEAEEDYVDPEVEAWNNNQYAAWHASRTNHGWGAQEVYAPHEYVADGASY